MTEQKEHPPAFPACLDLPRNPTHLAVNSDIPIFALEKRNRKKGASGSLLLL